jgi:beta-mannosidase
MSSNLTYLHGTWNLSGGDHKLTAEIPGDFHYALLKANIIKDPYVGYNELDCQWVGKTDWTIERDFEYTKIKGTKAILELTEADTYFTVYLNGEEVGKGMDEFSRHRFDVTSVIKDGENHIKIFFDSPEKKALEIAKNLPYPIPCSVYDVSSPNRNLVRKCQCNAGWDWGPCLMISGIYGHIYIETAADGIFENAMITYKLDDAEEKKWTATITSNYVAYKEGEKEFTFSITGDDIEEASKKVTVDLKNGVNKIEAKISVTNPWVWKTAGELREMKKKENLIYKLKVSENDSIVGDVFITKNICFSSLRVGCEEDEIGRSLYFENNGRKLFAKGSNWIPCDTMASRMTKERYRSLLQSAVDANQNIIRVWGGGIYEKEIFYDTCDKLGIIIYHDMMFACSTYPSTKEFLDEVRKELDYQIPRLQSHACIGLWAGNNEDFGAINWYEESKNNRTVYIMDYDRLNNGVVGAKIKELDPSRLFWPSSPSSGPDDYGDNWHSDNRGDMHYWSVWHEKMSFDAYLNIKPRFVSEFGYESFPSMDTIRTFAEEKDYNFTSKLMEYHQRSPIGNSIILENFSRYFRFPEGFKNMVYLSQVQQATAIKTAVEWWRALKPNCLGSIYWQLNDIWPGPSWSSLEYSGKWKLLMYAAKKFYEDIYLSFFAKDNKIHAFVCNDTNQDLHYELTVKYLKFDGTEYKKEDSVKGSIISDGNKEVYSEDIPTKDATEYFIYGELTVTNIEGETFVRDGTVFPGLYKHCDLADAKISCELKEKDENFEITIKSDYPAFFVSFDTEGIKGKFSENMFTLLPDKSKTVVYTPDEKIDVDDLKKALSIYDLRHTYK